MFQQEMLSSRLYQPTWHIGEIEPGFILLNEILRETLGMLKDFLKCNVLTMFINTKKSKLYNCNYLANGGSVLRMFSLAS